MGAGYQRGIVSTRVEVRKVVVSDERGIFLGVDRQTNKAVWSKDQPPPSPGLRAPTFLDEKELNEYVQEHGIQDMPAGRLYEVHRISTDNNHATIDDLAQMGLPRWDS